MRRREPHTIHFQEFENLKRDCYQNLGNGSIANCFERLDFYIKEHPDDEKSKSLVTLKGRNIKNEQDYTNNLIDRDQYNLERARIYHGIKILLDDCMPPDYDEYQQTSLRRKSKWDERDNLAIFLQFDRDFRYLKELFSSFEKDWKSQIQLEKYYMAKNGDEIILPEDAIEEPPPIGVTTGETVILPEDFESEQETDTNQEEDSQPEIETRYLHEKGKSLIIRKQYTKAVPEIDEYGKKEMVQEQENALAIVEKSESGLHISISAVGAIDAKCNLVNEILEWFEKHEFIVTGRYDPFTVCVPQAKSFTAFQYPHSKEVSISLKQPVSQ